MIEFINKPTDKEKMVISLKQKVVNKLVCFEILVYDGEKVNGWWAHPIPNGFVRVFKPE